MVPNTNSTSLKSEGATSTSTKLECIQSHVQQMIEEDYERCYGQNDTETGHIRKLRDSEQVFRETIMLWENDFLPNVRLCML
mmetsp:Transcript_8934/g.18026  ORF Transcript_8934/g.18026 Transcript_8934/m.18026 type:complete len:82 (+) Transcript_8934:219-464(+)